MGNELKDVEFFRQLWTRLVGDGFVPEKLVARVRLDGGYDIEGLTERMLLDLIDECFTGSWQEVAFSFSELSAYYLAVGERLSPEQVVGWVFAIFATADAINADATDWEMEFDKFIDVFMILRPRLELDESVQIFERVFRGTEKESASDSVSGC
jgi:hypothetical protein